MAAQSFKLELDDAIYQAAQQRAKEEGKSLEQVLVDFFATYTKGRVSQPPAPALAPAPATYTVKSGDTLSKIALAVYGDGTKYPLIQKANNLSDPSKIRVGHVLVIPPLSGAPAPQPPTKPSPSPQPPAPSPQQPAPSPGPGTGVDPCAPIPGEQYGTLAIVGRPTDRPAAQHGDLNLVLRGYNPCSETRGLIDMAGPTDDRAPQLAGLFADKRIPAVSNVYRVNQWDWGRNARGGPIGDFKVTLAGFTVKPGETIHTPGSGYSIGQGYAALVLYADANRITLKYTGEDSVVNGYAVHVDGVCVEPSLLALYERANTSGRGQLPALRAGQALGRARGSEIQVAIRDTGRFMDPRTRKDWWRGR